MTPSTINLFKKSPPITWEKLPDDFILPDEPVDNNLQPLLAAALRESLELVLLILTILVKRLLIGAASCCPQVRQVE